MLPNRLSHSMGDLESLPIEALLLEPSLCGKQPHHSFDKQSIPLSLSIYVLDKLLLGFVARTAFDEPCDFSLAERRNRNRPRFVDQVTNQLTQLCRALRLGFSVGTDH